MKRLQLVILLLLSIYQSSYAINDYFLAEEYYQYHKDQFTTYQNFINTVNTPATVITTAQPKPIKIYMVYPGEQISDYWKRSKLSFEARLKELGIKYQLKDFFTKPTIETHKPSYCFI